MNGNINEKTKTENWRQKTSKGQAAIGLNEKSFKARTLRGQAAMEYLMTYGWAILVIVIVLAALWYFSGQLFKAPESCLFSQPGLSCGDTRPTIFRDADGVVKLSVRVFNQQGQTVNVRKILCTNAALGDVKSGWAKDAATDIQAGGSSVFTAVRCGTTNNADLKSPAGTDFKGQFVIWYNFENDVDTTVLRQTSAAISGSVREK